MCGVPLPCPMVRGSLSTLACPSHGYHIVSHMTYHACSTIELALSYLSLPIGGMISNKEVWLHNYLTQDMREDGIYKAFYP